MKPPVFLALSLGKAFQQKLAERYEVIADPALCKSAKAIITVGTHGADGAYMDTMPELGIICCLGSGYRRHRRRRRHGARHCGHQHRRRKRVDRRRHGARPAARLDPPCRHRRPAHPRAGEWRGKNPAPLLFARGLTGRKVGVLGLGAIGRRIAERCAAFETEVGYFNRSKKPDAPWRCFEALAGLAEWADVLMVAHRADETNRHIVNADVMKALGPTGHIVNISRGSAIDEDALIAALKDGTIVSAGLDVFEDEPQIRPDLAGLPNIVMTPHIGGGTSEALKAMGDAVIANIDAFSDGRPLPNPVTVA